MAVTEEQRAYRRAYKQRNRRVVPIDRMAIFARDEGRCHLCGHPCDPKAFDLDHLVPLSKGGEHTPENVATSHPSCNRSRGTKPLSGEVK